MNASTDDFAQRLLAWYDHSGRHDLPWMHPRTPYRVWLSEIMLQQTQVKTVMPYFERFVARVADVCPRWPRRRRTKCWRCGRGWVTTPARATCTSTAQRCVELHGGDLPRDLDALIALPGIGRSTAGAILAQAWGDRFAILDGNVKRVLSALPRHRRLAEYAGRRKRNVAAGAMRICPHAARWPITPRRRWISARRCARAMIRPA